MAFDPRLALTFVAIAKEGSFTRAAERLNVAQPWVSEQLKRLETQVGFPLLERSTRHMRLTPHGARFLEHAKALLEAQTAAQAYVDDVRQGEAETLRIGAVYVLLREPVRAELIAAFAQACPQVRMEIANGAADELLKRLGDGELDVVLGFGAAAEDSRGLEEARICTRYGHLMTPLSDPLSACEEVSLDQMAGRTVVLNPGRADSNLVRRATAPLAATGARIEFAPESNDLTTTVYARSRNAMCVRWLPGPTPRHLWEGMACLPIAGSPLRMEVKLTAVRGPRRPAVRRFWGFARRFRESAWPSEGGPSAPGARIGGDA